MGETRTYVTSKSALVDFLAAAGNQVTDLIYWNNDLVSLGEALRRAQRLSGSERIARRHDLILVAAAA